jgi:hypothetical protein
MRRRTRRQSAGRALISLSRRTGAETRAEARHNADKHDEHDVGSRSRYRQHPALPHSTVGVDGGLPRAEASETFPCEIRAAVLADVAALAGKAGQAPGYQSGRRRMNASRTYNVAGPEV